MTSSTSNMFLSHEGIRSWTSYTSFYTILMPFGTSTPLVALVRSLLSHRRLRRSAVGCLVCLLSLPLRVCSPSPLGQTIRLREKTSPFSLFHENLITQGIFFSWLLSLCWGFDHVIRRDLRSCQQHRLALGKSSHFPSWPVTLHSLQRCPVQGFPTSLPSTLAFLVGLPIYFLLIKRIQGKTVFFIFPPILVSPQRLQPGGSQMSPERTERLVQIQDREVLSNTETYPDCLLYSLS